MPTYNNLTSRADAQALVPEEVSKELLTTATEESAVLQRFRRIPVSRNQVRFPVLSALPLAYWVTGDTGLKQTSEINWTNKFMNIEEIATIIPVPDSVLADVDANVWDEAMPYLAQAVGRTLDQAVFFGTNAPASFPTALVPSAAAAGNAITEGSTAAQGGYLGDIDKAYGALETDGFEAEGWVAGLGLRGKLRGARDTLGQKIDASRVSGDLKTIDGLPISYPMRGLWPSAGGAGTNVRAMVGDFDNFVVGVRQDITLKVLTEAVIQDNSGAIIYNLAQQDMTALRLTFRVGWQVANTINNDQPVEANRYPVATLVF